MNGHRPSLPFNLNSLAGQVVKPDAVFLDRRIHRRNLQDFSPEMGKGAFQRLFIRGYRKGLLDRARAVLGIGNHTQPESSHIFFSAVGSQVLGLSSAADQNWQNAGSHRV